MAAMMAEAPRTSPSATPALAFRPDRLSAPRPRPDPTTLKDDKSLAAWGPGSTGRRNSCVRRSQQLVKGLGRCSPAQDFAWPAIEGRSHRGKVVRTMLAQVGDGVDAPRRHRGAKVVVLTAT